MPIFDDFSTGSPNGSLWEDVAGSMVRTAFAGRQSSLLFNGNGYRYARTKRINTEIDQYLEFDLIYGDGLNGAARNDAEIKLEYSTNNGASWSSLRSYSFPNQWTRFGLHLPLAARSPQTLIRWVQNDRGAYLAAGSNAWALDNVSIRSQPTSPPTATDGSKDFDDGFWSDISNAGITDTFAGRSKAIAFEGEGYRFAQTAPINTKRFKALQFDLIYGDRANGKARNEKEISLQFSINNGASWSTLQTYSHPSQWTHFQVNIPLAAQADNTLIRWLQNDSGAYIRAGSSPWALDNISFQEPAEMHPFFVDFSNDFNDGLWSDISNARISDAFTGRKQSLTFDGEGYRFAETVAINTRNFSALSFDLIYGDGSNGGSRNDRDISLQYSTNKGASWSTLQTYSMPARWTSFNVDLPIAAQTDSTLIRWVQNDSGAYLAAGSNAWALDNIRFNLSYIPGSASAKGVNFGRTAKGDYAVKNAGGFAVPVTFAGQFASDSQPGSGWTGVVASPSGKDYKFYLKNAGSYARWRLDASGALASSSFLSEAELYYEEADISYDINGDGRVGIEYVPGKKSIGDVNLGTTALGYAIRKGAAAAVQVTFSGKNASAANPGSNWSAVAAAAGSGAGYTVYWKNSSNGAFSRWRLDDSGSLSTSAFLSTSELYSEEQNLKIDLDDDGKIGLVFQAGPTTIGGVNFGANPLGYALKKGSGSEVQVSLLGKAVSDSYPGSGWSAVAAAAGAGPGSAYRLFWRHQGTGRFSRWHLDDSGAHASSSFLSEVELYAEEKELNHDLNKDGKIGLRYQPGATTIGTVNLGSNDLGYALKKGVSDDVQVTFQGRIASAANLGGLWTAVAAAGGADGSGYRLYWRSTNGDQFSRWLLDNNGALSSSSFLSKADLATEEKVLGHDLNNDGRIGLAFSPGIATIGSTTLGTNELGYAVRYGSRPEVQVTFFGQVASSANPGSTWTAVAAEGSDSGFDLYWRQGTTGQMSKWELSSTGQLESSEFLSQRKLYKTETRLAYDLDRDGITGIPTTVFATAKGVGLANSTIGYCIKPADGAAIAVTAFEKDVSANYPGGGWRAIAAATPTTPTPGVAYDLYWVNNLSKAYAKWSLNSAGASIGSSLLGVADVLEAERAIAFDLSSNGVIGSL